MILNLVTIIFIIKKKIIEEYRNFTSCTNVIDSDVLMFSNDNKTKLSTKKL